MKAHIAINGIPNKLMSDSGPNFSRFKLFTDSYNIEHITSSPTYAQSISKVENSVKTAKKIMQKALDAHADPYLAFLDFRNSPTELRLHNHTGTANAQPTKKDTTANVQQITNLEPRSHSV